MGKSNSVLIAVGGGEFGEAETIVKEFIGLVEKRADPRIVVMTVATNEPESAVVKYNNLFRGRGIKHVESVDVSKREDSFSNASIKKISGADALYFTGGDQLNITTLLGGSPVHEAIRDRVKEGIIVAGISAGAAMMSKWMIISGRSDEAPRVGNVEIAPGMDLVNGMIIDTHFSQRGRNGRLLTAIAHYPQALGVGIDERTAIVIRGGEFRVIGEGVATVIDSSGMKQNDLPYRREGEAIGMAGAVIDVLPEGYRYKIGRREAVSPSFRTLVNAA